jgi:branched-chain amino acid aminotransferase
MEIARELVPEGKRKPLVGDPLKLPFGRHFTDHMFTMEYTPARGWSDPRIKPYEPLLIDPAATVLHYGQEVFEGQKAYKSPQGKILLFRPMENARRFNRSLRRMCMPEIPEEVFLEAECELLKVEARWVPDPKGTSLYVRPVVIGTEAALGNKPAHEYLFYIILLPTGPYFHGGPSPIRLWVSDTYSRAAAGGTGEAKTGGNYAGSMLAAREAAEKGYDQVLWLDAGQHRFVEELGGMNIFFVMEGSLVTPALDGTILHGITRRSILDLAPELGIKAEERRITIDEIVDGIASGRVSEAFCTGTAAVVSPVGTIAFRNVDRVINGNVTGPWTTRFLDALTAIQYGEAEDKRGWVHVVK